MGTSYPQTFEAPRRFTESNVHKPAFEAVANSFKTWATRLPWSPPTSCSALCTRRGGRSPKMLL